MPVFRDCGQSLHADIPEHVHVVCERVVPDFGCADAVIAAQAFPDAVYLPVSALIAAMRQPAVGDIQYVTMKAQHSRLHQVLYMLIAQFYAQFPG